MLLSWENIYVYKLTFTTVGNETLQCSLKPGLGRGMSNGELEIRVKNVNMKSDLNVIVFNM